MKKEDKKISLLDVNVTLSKDFKKEGFKTADINILLNRVRLNKKRTFRKRISISLFFVTIITALTVYFTIY